MDVTFSHKKQLSLAEPRPIQAQRIAKLEYAQYLVPFESTFTILLHVVHIIDESNIIALSSRTARTQWQHNSYTSIQHICDSMPFLVSPQKEASNDSEIKQVLNGNKINIIIIYFFFFIESSRGWIAQTNQIFSLGVAAAKIRWIRCATGNNKSSFNIRVLIHLPPASHTAGGMLCYDYMHVCAHALQYICQFLSFSM